MSSFLSVKTVDQDLFNKNRNYPNVFILRPILYLDYGRMSSISVEQGRGRKIIKNRNVVNLFRSRISEMKIQKILLKAFLACVASGQFINWKGECKSVPKIKKFNLQKVLLLLFFKIYPGTKLLWDSRPWVKNPWDWNFQSGSPVPCRFLVAVVSYSQEFDLYRFFKKI